MDVRGLYIHLPFCLRKCRYCDFVITTDRSRGTRRRFFAALEKEIARAAARHRALGFDTLYLGGGTPSLLEHAEIRRLLELLRGNFRIAPGAETTCEVNPGDSDASALETYRSVGINRISVGAQSFSDRLLREIGRAHDADAVRRTLHLLKENGFRNISVDLILRLPGQTVEEVVSSIEEAIRFGASQVVLYDLDVHERTAYGLWERQGRLVLPTEPIHERMFAAARDLLEEAGYLHEELMTFTQPGFGSKHNRIYWNNGEYLGLGPGAYSYIGSVRWRFAPDVRSYLRKCEQDNWEPEESEVLSEENRQVETLLTGLRLAAGVNLAALPLLRAQLEEAAPPLVESGLLAHAGDRLRLTPRGRFVAESVITRLVTACLNA